MSLKLRHSVSNRNNVSKNFDDFFQMKEFLMKRASFSDPKTRFYPEFLSEARKTTSPRPLTSETRTPVMSDNGNLMGMFDR